jgi:hypothetical protein
MKNNEKKTFIVLLFSCDKQKVKIKWKLDICKT